MLTMQLSQFWAVNTHVAIYMDCRVSPAMTGFRDVRRVIRLRSEAFVILPAGDVILRRCMERCVQIKVARARCREGEFWAEVPAIPGCATQGETMDELLRNIHDATSAACRLIISNPVKHGHATRRGIGRIRRFIGWSGWGFIRRIGRAMRRVKGLRLR